MMVSDSFNDEQKELIESTEGFVCVDAGPGTGKTFTIVERYVNILKKNRGLDPRRILMATFTRNGAAEMNERIGRRMHRVDANGNTDPELASLAKYVNVCTFDSFCNSVTSDRTDVIDDMFGFDLSLVSTCELNGKENTSVMREILEDMSDSCEFRYYPKLALTDVENVCNVLSSLMCKGIIPLKGEGEWFSIDDHEGISGDHDQLIDDLDRANQTYVHDNNNSEINYIRSVLDKFKDYKLAINRNKINVRRNKQLDSEQIWELARYDADDVQNFFHHIYREYVTRSIALGRLSYGLNSILAFIMLYVDKDLRERNSFEYIMIDEFQDTNKIQLAVIMMLLRRNQYGSANLCVIGDWKQGIYEFRFADIENILNFEGSVETIFSKLNENDARLPYSLSRAYEDSKGRFTKTIDFRVNYRSSQKIIDASFESLYLRDDLGQVMNQDAQSKIVELTQGREKLRDETGVSLLCMPYVDDEEEVKEYNEEFGTKCKILVTAYEDDIILERILELMSSDEYKVVLNDDSEEKYRSMRYGDIAILCRTNNECAELYESLKGSGIPLHLCGQSAIMRSAAGKLVLAWLTFIRDYRDGTGYPVIMSYEGCSMPEILYVKHNMKELGLDSLPDDLVRRYNEFNQIKDDIPHLISEILSQCGPYDDNSQAIYNELCSRFDDGHSTISDIIDSMAADIDKGITYDIDNAVDESAVNIMTMHASKGLEFEAVIIPYVNFENIPFVQGARMKNFMYDSAMGLRCCMNIELKEDIEKVKDVRTHFLCTLFKYQSDTERRLLFVAMSRARQYLVMTYHPQEDTGKFSPFAHDLEERLKDYSREFPSGGELKEFKRLPLVEPPLIDVSGRRIYKLSVHDIMDYKADYSKKRTVDSETGMSHGTRVHSYAESLVYGCEHDLIVKEDANISKILSDRKPDSIVRAEVPCTYRIKDVCKDTDAVLSGFIDLTIDEGDRFVIHDYKTGRQADEYLHHEYEVQLAVYGLIAKEMYPDKDVHCYIDYISCGDLKQFEVKVDDDIRNEIRQRAADEIQKRMIQS